MNESCAFFGQLIVNGVFTRSSKRPANFQQMYSKLYIKNCNVMY